jgi:hypothetical protein
LDIYDICALVGCKAGWLALCHRMYAEGEKNNEAIDTDEIEIRPPPQNQQRPFPSVDVMFVVQKLAKEKALNQKELSKLSGCVAKRDPRLLLLINRHKHTKLQPLLTRSADFRKALIDLARAPDLPPAPPIETGNVGESAFARALNLAI